MEKAAITKGVTEAKIILPDMPADCTKREPHATVRVGDQTISVLDRERGALDRANARIDRCNGSGGFYDQVKSDIALNGVTP